MALTTSCSLTHSSHIPDGAAAFRSIFPVDPPPTNDRVNHCCFAASSCFFSASALCSLFSGNHSSTNLTKSTFEDWEENITRYLPLFSAALLGKWDVAQAIIDRDKDAPSARLSCYQQTVLHYAVSATHSLPFLKNLVEKMSVQDLETKDSLGGTALTYAAICGNLEAAKILVRINSVLPQIPNDNNDTPLHYAAASGHKDMVEYLLSVTTNDPPHPFSGRAGANLLNLLITADLYGIALRLLHEYPNLAIEKDEGRMTPLMKLAQKPGAFQSGSHLGSWQRFFYKYINVSLHQPNLSINPQNPSQLGNGCLSLKCGALLGSCWNTFVKSVTILSKIHDVKLMHMQALELVRVICRETVKAHPVRIENLYTSALVMASKLGISELIFEVIKSFPHIIWIADDTGCNIFQLAVLNRNEGVFNLIYQMSSNKHFTASEDHKGNNTLHFAGRLEPSSSISGAALQMQRELKWFKEVEKVIQPSYKERKNKDGKTPAMIFSEEHKTLVKQGEEWMKVAATSCTVVAALIATVAFSAAFTAPGGNDNSGRPNFIDRPAFIVYAVSDGIAFFFSFIAVMMFLAILTSRYVEEDFLESLPKKMIYGLVSMFISLASMMVAFGSSIHLLLVSRWTRRSWDMIPVLIAAFVPIALFALMQFPLLVRITGLTYGPSIFGSQRKKIFY